MSSRPPQCSPGLEGDHRIVDLEYLSSAQHVPVEELKLSLVDVKCLDQRDRHYVVEMQVLNRSPALKPAKRATSNASRYGVCDRASGTTSRFFASRKK